MKHPDQSFRMFGYVYPGVPFHEDFQFLVHEKNITSFSFISRKLLTIHCKELVSDRKKQPLFHFYVQLTLNISVSENETKP